MMLRHDRNATPGCCLMAGVALIATTALAAATIITCAIRALS